MRPGSAFQKAASSFERSGGAGGGGFAGAGIAGAAKPPAVISEDRESLSSGTAPPTTIASTEPEVGAVSTGARGRDWFEWVEIAEKLIYSSLRINKTGLSRELCSGRIC